MGAASGPLVSESAGEVACNLCGGHRASLLLRPRRSPGPVVRCRDCGLVYVSPRLRLEHVVSETRPLDVPPELRLAADLSALKHRWEMPLIEEYLKEYSQKTANAHRLLAKIERFVPRGRILDFGCGPGLFLAAAKSRGWEAHGLEPLVGFAIFARGRFGLRVVNDFLRDDTLPDAYYDVTTALQVLEHLTDPLDSLRRLRRVVRPGGLVVAEVPCISSLWVRLLGPRHRHFVEDHLYFFSPETLRRLLEKAGFQVLEVGYSSRSISARSCLRQLLRHAGASPKALDAAERLLGWTSLGGVTFTLNLGDIVHAFGSKEG